MRKPFYGWIILLAGIMIMAISVGIVYNCLPLYIVPICDEMGFSRRAGATMETLYSVGAILVAATSVRLYKRFKIQHTMRIAAVVLSLAYFCYSRAHALWEFCLISLTASYALWSLAYIPFAIVLNNWFHKHSGCVIGLTFMGTGIGGMLFNPIVGGLIASIGWRHTFSAMSIVLAGVLIPCMLLIRDSPAEKGLEPLGTEGGGDAPSCRGDVPAGVDMAHARREARFYLLAISMAMLNVIGTGFVMTFGSYLSDRGYGVEAASRIMAGMMASLAVGKISLGWLYDRLGHRLATALAGISLAATLFAALCLPGTAAVLVMVAAFALGLAFGSVASPILTKAAYGMRDFSRINGFFVMTSGVVSSFGPVFSGWICDMTGSYEGSYWIYLGLALVFPVIIIVCLPRRKQVAAGLGEKNR